MDNFAVLLIEDNPDDEFLTRWVLSKCGIGRLTVAHDGREAIHLLLGSGTVAPPVPDLVILDLRLPKIGGIEVLRRIRDDARLAALPVMVLTSSEDPGDKQVCSRLGIVSFIAKPLHADDLMRIVRRCKKP